MAKVFVCVPSYGPDASWLMSEAVWVRATKAHRTDVGRRAGSLIPTNCNVFWCEVLNSRVERAWDWLAMLHTDVEPQPLWLDALIAEAEKHNADIMSAVIPLKDAIGCTSTGISDPRDPWEPFCRLTQSQVCHASFPDTFDIHAAADALERLPEPLRIQSVPREFLLTNTGCMVVRLNRPWIERIWFDQSDSIRCVNGRWLPFSMSEDWNFSRRVASEGGKVMATKVIALAHRGTTQFMSNQIWGSPRDPNQKS